MKGIKETRRLLALGWILLLGLSGQSQPAPGAGSQGTLHQVESSTSRGRQLASYRVFATHCTLPTITTNGGEVQIAGKYLVSTSPTATLPTERLQELAKLFDLPIPVLTGFLKSWRAKPALTARVMAVELQSSIIDYKYLLSRWTAMHPTAEKEHLKDTALAALNSGDLNQAWELYLSPERPAAPTNFRFGSP